MEPYFTVIIATYNRSTLLIRALESLMNQTEKDWEAIVVDDGSKDDTYSQFLLYKKNIRR
jgi:glycosyltransferase involved in cell wall biosynthesis